MTRPGTITLPESDAVHMVGDKGCEQDWCGAGGYPAPCEYEGCAGLVHAAFGDEHRDGGYWLFTRCDVCGESG